MNTSALAEPRAVRRFLPHDFAVSGWDALQPHFDRLMSRPVDTVEGLKQWLADRSELDAAIAEDLGWRYIHTTCFTEREDYRQHYQRFAAQIQPQLSAYADRLNRKVAAAPATSALARQPDYAVFLRSLQESIKLFREENIPLFTQVETLTQEYNRIIGAMTIVHGQQEITLQQAAALLLSNDRALREAVYGRMMQRRLQDAERLDALFSDLTLLRCTIARQAECANFCDYMFRAYCRFDYTPQDCFRFHEAIAAEGVPYLNKLAEQRRAALGVNTLRPWDAAVDLGGSPPLKAFDGEADLMSKTTECFGRIDPFLGQCMSVLRQSGRLDLVSRKGKAAGGYNYPLPDTGIPFIFMNATSTLRDAVTLIHEGGHAVHSLLLRDQELLDFKSPPTEAAELASMAMELISMEHWDVFFPDPMALRQAKREHLEGILETLPWVATIDAYQHWIYQHPQHTVEERTQAWGRIFDTFFNSVTDWSGLDAGRNKLWHKQGHLYEAPFYYIEYGIAQLGAIAVWRNYKEDRQRGLDGYLSALRVGNTRSLPRIYEAAHIRFDFSRPYIRELMAFVWGELKAIERGPV